MIVLEEPALDVPRDVGLEIARVARVAREHEQVLARARLERVAQVLRVRDAPAVALELGEAV